MGSRTLMEPVVSMAGLSNGASLVSGSSSVSMRLSIRQSDQRPRAAMLSGNVRASLPAEDPRRSAFGQGAVCSRSTRFDVRVCSMLFCLVCKRNLELWECETLNPERWTDFKR